MLSSHIVRFILVGVSASLVNFFMVIFIVSTSTISPLYANIIGFITAFSVSYVGHKNWTFPKNKHSHATALTRFIIVALIGFTINESCYALLLNFTWLDYRISLIITLIIAAVSTYLLSRYWAFAYASNQE